MLCSPLSANQSAAHCCSKLVCFQSFYAVGTLRPGSSQFSAMHRACKPPHQNRTRIRILVCSGDINPRDPQTLANGPHHPPRPNANPDCVMGALCMPKYESIIEMAFLLWSSYRAACLSFSHALQHSLKAHQRYRYWLPQASYEVLYHSSPLPPACRLSSDFLDHSQVTRCAPPNFILLCKRKRSRLSTIPLKVTSLIRDTRMTTRMNRS